MPNTPIKTHEQTLEKSMRQLGTMLGLLKTIVGMGAACVAVTFAAFLWFINTTSGLAATQEAIKQINISTNERVHDWSAWRSETDKQITKLTTIVEAQAITNARLEQLVRQKNP